jgi:hypothetical protein
MSINFFFAPFFAVSRLQNIEIFFNKLLLALQKFMILGAPAVLLFCSLALFKAFFQSVIGQRNTEKKLTFIAALIWGFFAVLSFYLLTGKPLPEPMAFACACVTIVFALIVPLCVAITYLYTTIFCCDETNCSREIFSSHPPLAIPLLVLTYLFVASFWLFKAFNEQKLFYFKPKLLVASKNQQPKRNLLPKNK